MYTAKHRRVLGFAIAFVSILAGEVAGVAAAMQQI
jgi:hypothetical protein